MKKKLSLSQEYFLKVYEMFMGTRYSLNMDTWGGLIRKLDEFRYTPFEFLYFVAYRLYGKPSLHVLRYTNCVLSKDTWAAFEEYKKNLQAETDVAASTGREMLSTKENLFKTSVLDREDLSVKNPVLLDYALMMEALQGRDIKSVVDKRLVDCVWMVTCEPEWLNSCPYLKEYLVSEGYIGGID